MSLRDDLETLIQAAAWTPPPSDDEILGACSRLRAALTPTAEKWLEALPELIKLRKECETRWETAHSSSFKVSQQNVNAFRAILNDLSRALHNAIHEAAALHNATDEKEK